MSEQQKEVSESEAIREHAKMHATKMEIKVSQDNLERMLAWYIALDPSDIDKEDEELADILEGYAETDIGPIPRPSTSDEPTKESPPTQGEKSCTTCGREECEPERCLNDNMEYWIPEPLKKQGETDLSELISQMDNYALEIETLTKGIPGYEIYNLADNIRRLNQPMRNCLKPPELISSEEKQGVNCHRCGVAMMVNKIPEDAKECPWFCDDCLEPPESKQQSTVEKSCKTCYWEGNSDCEKDVRGYADCVDSDYANWKPKKSTQDSQQSSSSSFCRKSPPAVDNENDGWQPPDCFECGGPMVHKSNGHDNCEHWYCAKCDDGPDGKNCCWNFPAGFEIDDPCPECYPKWWEAEEIIRPIPDVNAQPIKEKSESTEEFSRKFGTCFGCNKTDVRVVRVEPLGDLCIDCHWDLEQQTPLGEK